MLVNPIIEMKRLIVLVLIIGLSVSCKNDSKSSQASQIEQQIEAEKDAPKLLKGEFLYYDDAAILQTKEEIYGVLGNPKLEALKARAELIKNEPTEMVLVEIKGNISDKKDDKILWEHKIEIVEILSVTVAPENTNNVVKLAN